ncbi:metallophosphoesterase family protein [Alloalcanivorax xenomutans]|jgi:calcineurin-like phosphoesterase family protein|uniref:Metallophosphoesterase n=1 Tax=Alloalcanivorax xenomutans TaxID=1094342 RepID=A0A9Q3W8I4_9GAMM|nr:metallophosphoesterase [Alloalcanivorax xenomutans]ERS13325.1 Ser/Thr protein phosphatase [Alcanivorax sp. PN-3]MCE7510985.1 metallophosphoesterase [Alloalcanivorax xenomutans]MCE7525373.1 metallophosphoesterase [Alloalcanivorax xenomutans]
MRFTALPLYAVLLGGLLSACGGSSSSSDSGTPPTDPGSGGETPTPTPVSTLRIGLLPDTQGGGDNVSMHPMKAVLDKEQELGVDIVIPVGDLTDHGTTREFEQWTSVAESYRDAGIEFLPLMGNHEDSYAYSVEWIENMKHYIPDDAVHMSGAQYLNYYVIRDNVMIFLLKYYNLPIAFDWIKQEVAAHEGEFDHLVIASHDGLIGAKYGETREMIVEGTAGDDHLMNKWDDIRAFFSKHDVIWVQGHEHMYQRSVIKAPIWVDPTSWTEDDGNYRLPQYTQIMSGNASYKGYEFRYGERELVQRIVQQKMNTMKNGSTAYDVNASVLTFQGDRVDYQSWFTEHTIGANEDGEKELAAPQWKLLDRFSRTKNRCERIVYPNSIPEGTRPVMYLDSSYISNDCYAPDGSVARMVGGTNDTFNRVESRTRDMEVTPGFSRASTVTELARLAYQFLFQYNQPWTPNLNAENRVVPNADDAAVLDIPETTIDLKEDVTMSWQAANGDTASDILIISGTQNQTGTYSNAYGAAKDLETDTGLPGSQPDGTAKQAHALPASASKNWDLATAVSDAYAVTFDADEGVDTDSHTLAWRTADGWQAIAGTDCVVEQPFDSAFLSTPPNRPDACADQPLVGFDADHGRRWWTVLQQDAELALISR